MKNIMLFILMCLVLTACGGGDTDSGGARVSTVTFNLDPLAGVQCSDNDDASVFESPDSNYFSVTCIWFCTNYKGRQRVYVSLDFVSANSTGNRWILDHEFISDGICD